MIKRLTAASLALRPSGGDGAHHARRTGRPDARLFPQRAALRSRGPGPPMAHAALVHRLWRSPSGTGRPFGVRGRLGPGERVERPRRIEQARPVWVPLGDGHFAAKSPVFEGWKSLDFLGFSRPKRAFSMGYAGFSLKKISRGPLALMRAAGADRLEPLGLRKGAIVHGRSLKSFLTFRNKLSADHDGPVSAVSLVWNGHYAGTRLARRPDGVGHHGAALAKRLFSADG